jgi:hypothetical protein
MSFQDAQTVNGVIFLSYQAAAMELGLFADANEAIYAHPLHPSSTSFAFRSSSH